MKDRKLTIEHLGAIRHGDWKLLVGLHGNRLRKELEEVCKDMLEDQIKSCIAEGLLFFRPKGYKTVKAENAQILKENSQSYRHLLVERNGTVKAYVKHLLNHKKATIFILPILKD